MTCFATSINTQKRIDHHAYIYETLTGLAQRCWGLLSAEKPISSVHGETRKGFDVDVRHIIYNIHTKFITTAIRDLNLCNGSYSKRWFPSDSIMLKLKIVIDSLVLIRDRRIAEERRHRQEIMEIFNNIDFISNFKPKRDKSLQFI